MRRRAQSPMDSGSSWWQRMILRLWRTSRPSSMSMTRITPGSSSRMRSRLWWSSWELSSRTRRLTTCSVSWTLTGVGLSISRSLPWLFCTRRLPSRGSSTSARLPRRCSTSSTSRVAALSRPRTFLCRWRNWAATGTVMASSSSSTRSTLMALERSASLSSLPTSTRLRLKFGHSAAMHSEAGNVHRFLQTLPRKTYQISKFGRCLCASGDSMRPWCRDWVARDLIGRGPSAISSYQISPKVGPHQGWNGCGGFDR
mmetsp:Transcript_26562/g.41575  ORF Transcript_26562/g.41575 Transcript_26562/m.41575 type:complete len:256 (+) Transcript_26562:606-1373(+)